MVYVVHGKTDAELWVNGVQFATKADGTVEYWFKFRMN